MTSPNYFSFILPYPFPTFPKAHGPRSTPLINNTIAV